jgi:hypothetical protein
VCLFAYALGQPERVAGAATPAISYVGEPVEMGCRSLPMHLSQCAAVELKATLQATHTI